jgi:uncharacterized protein (DUF2267 family)
MSPPLELTIPVLTDVIGGAAPPPAGELESLLAEVQTKLASRTFSLADELLRSAFAEMEATLLKQISAKLREQLPELIDATLREHFDTRNDP